MASLSSADGNAENVRVAYLLDCSGAVYEESVSFFVSEVKMFELTDRSDMAVLLSQTVALVPYVRYETYHSSRRYHPMTSRSSIGRRLKLRISRVVGRLRREVLDRRRRLQTVGVSLRNTVSMFKGFHLTMFQVRSNNKKRSAAYLSDACKRYRVPKRL